MSNYGSLVITIPSTTTTCSDNLTLGEIPATRQRALRRPRPAVVGEVPSVGDLQEFLPLFILGQFTHVRKHAVWENGQYELVTER